MTFYSTMKNCNVKLITTIFSNVDHSFPTVYRFERPKSRYPSLWEMSWHCAQLPLDQPSMEAIEFSIVGGSPISNFSNPVVSFENLMTRNALPNYAGYITPIV